MISLKSINMSERFCYNREIAVAFIAMSANRWSEEKMS